MVHKILCLVSPSLFVVLQLSSLILLWSDSSLMIPTLILGEASRWSGRYRTNAKCSSQLTLPTADHIIGGGGVVKPTPSARCVQLAARETHIHMMSQCLFARAVWRRIAQWFEMRLPRHRSRSILQWRSKIRRNRSIYRYRGHIHGLAHLEGNMPVHLSSNSFYH